MHKINLSQLHFTLTQIAQKHKKYKSTFLVKQDESLAPIGVKEFAYFTIKSRIIRGTTFDKESIIINKKMSDLEAKLDPSQFFRVNRQFIIQRAAIKKINYAVNGKLTLTVSPNLNEQILISKTKSKHFKIWMNK